MNSLQCPNIKIDILNLRSKVGELRSLKTDLLQNDPQYQNDLSTLQGEIDGLVVEINKKIDVVANETLKPQIEKPGVYIIVKEFSEGRAVVQDKDGNWFHIKSDGKRAYTENYLRVGNFNEGRARVRDMDGNWFHIKPNGDRAYAEHYIDVGEFYEGRARVRDMDGNWFHIKSDGERAYVENYIDLGSYNEGRVRVQDMYDNEFYIDIDGKRLPD